MSNSLRKQLVENFRKVQERVQAACERSRRNPEQVRLLPITKYVGIDVIRQVIDMGYHEIGESRVQDLTMRASMLQESFARRRREAGPGAKPPARWHMVGHLQRNKVKAVLPWVEMIHSVDSLRLAEDLNRHAAVLDRPVPVLLQINVSGEKSKHGIAVGAAVHVAEQVVTLPNVTLAGLMTMAPISTDRPFLRNCFSRLRELLEEIRYERFGTPDMRHLSMGMTQDFELAVEEGATVIRVGSALFEGVEQFSGQQK
jgi:pyridoxal phosphate enzyme (YggS family)